MNDPVEPANVPEQLLWEGRPSVFQFAGTHILTLIILYAGFKLAYMIYPHPWYYLTHIRWNKPIFAYTSRDWPQFALAAIYIIMLLSVLNAISKFLQSKLTQYQLLNDQIIIKRFTLLGFVIHHTEVYRIVDFEQIEPFTLMVFGLSNIILHSTDKQIPVIELSAVHRGKEVIHFFRNETERVRREKGVREFTTRWN